jgi:putative hydrolase of the HAD superfamily
MPLTDHKILTFDVVGTLIDFETGVLDYLCHRANGASDQAILEAYATAEHHQHHETPRLPFPSMLAPMYREMAASLGMPHSQLDVDGFRLSIPRWPAFPDSVAALKQLRRKFRLVAMTNSDNWALDHFAATLGQPFDDRITAQDVGWNKPDPQFFAYTRGRQSVHGFTLNDFVHVAQSQYHDIVVAGQLGYRTCWIERRKGKPGAGGTPAVSQIAKADYHFATLAELADAAEAGE